MSRYYGMSLTVKNFNRKKLKAIKVAAKDHWPFTDWSHAPDELFCYAESSLGGGEGEDEFAERLAGAIFAANGGQCEIDLDAAFLEDPPTQSFFFGAAEYEELVGSTQSKGGGNENGNDGG